MTRDCIEWKGRTDKDGYGTIGSRRAHRVAWEQTFGPIPDGLQVLHKCDNPPCINVGHLRLGTQADNAHDRNAKGRQARGGRHGLAKLTEDDVRFIRSSPLSTNTLAMYFDVHQTTIQKARFGRSWRHIQPTTRKEEAI